jgi:primosomal protein N' (replication factor Y)
VCFSFKVSGCRTGIYYSKFLDAERVGIWRKQLAGKGHDIGLGVTSSIFLTFQDLGPVIVDEWYKNTYQQQDPAPRYHARHVAMVLTSLDGAKKLLRTAKL